MELAELRAQAKAQGVPVMQDGGLDFLCACIRSHPDIKAVLEAGCAVGCSAIAMASVRPDITVDTLEIDPASAAQAVRNIADAGLADRIHVHVIDAVNYQPERVYDMIFIDAAKSQYRSHLEHFYPYSHKGTVFFFDNLCFHGIVDHPELSHNRSTLQMTRKIRAFREWLRVEPRFACDYHPEIGDGVAAAVRVR